MLHFNDTSATKKLELNKIRITSHLADTPYSRQTNQAYTAFLASRMRRRSSTKNENPVTADWTNTCSAT
jgi:hypothetical protein